MSGFLLDTNVISMFSPSAADPGGIFVAWMARREEEGGLCLSAVTIHEIEKGIRLLEAKGATAKAASIDTFLHGLVSGYGQRILPFSTEVALAAGRLEAQALLSGHNPGASDAMIAGTAVVHDLTIVTRNLRHFRAFAVRVISPDEILSSGG